MKKRKQGPLLKRPEQNDQNHAGLIDVFALFSDRSAAQIKLSLFSRQPGEPPIIDGFNDDAAVKRSAQRGFFSALGYYELLNLEPFVRQYVIWDFADNAHGLNNYNGASAGLAFFICTLVELLGRQRSPSASFSVAATGELSDSSRDALVNRIESLPEKLQAAFSVLTRPGDKILYPAANDADVDDHLRRMAAEKGVELFPVATTAEAAKIVFQWFTILPDEPADADKKPAIPSKHRLHLRKRWLLIGAAILAILSLLSLYQLRRLHPVVLTQRIEQGEFERVPLQRLRSAPDPTLRRLAQKTRIPLDLRCSFIYLDDGRTLARDAGSLTQMQNVILSDSTGYRFEVLPDFPCYFYLFQFQADSIVELHFPASPFDLENHYLLDQQLYLIPGGLKYIYFKTNRSRQLVTLFFLGSLWRAHDVESLCQLYDQAGAGEKIKYRDLLLQAIQTRARALQNGWHGLYVQQGFFWRQ